MKGVSRETSTYVALHKREKQAALGTMSAKEIKAVTQCVTRILDVDMYTDARGFVEVFAQPVSMFDYKKMIPLPMCLSFIQRRLKNGYYRSLVSVLRDVRQIRINAQHYNNPGSDIFRDAARCEYLVYHEIVRAVQEISADSLDGVPPASVNDAVAHFFPAPQFKGSVRMD
jgi:hypothetical protein